jgi:hypothetical protein
MDHRAQTLIKSQDYSRLYRNLFQEQPFDTLKILLPVERLTGFAPNKKASTSYDDSATLDADYLARPAQDAVLTSATRKVPSLV